MRPWSRSVIRARMNSASSRSQLPDLERDNTAVAVCEHRKRQHRVHPERTDHFKAALLAHEQRIGDVLLDGVFCHIFAMIDGDADHFESHL